MRGGGAHCYYLYDIKGNEKYLYYALKSQQDRLMALRSGACMPNIKKSDLGEFFFEYENNLKRQGEIVDRLDILENCISLAQEEVEKLDLLVKSRFVEMFGSSKINPKGWEIVPLESLARVGSSKRVFVEELRTMGIPFYRGTEIGALAEGKNIVPELYITEEHYQMLISANGKVNKGDLLMPSICPDGRIWLVNTAEPFYYKDGRVLWIHPISDCINSCYLQYVLKEKFMTDYGSIASGNTFAELKIFALKSLGIMLAPVVLQNQFAIFVQQTDKLKSIVKESLKKLETMKKSLMQQYFG